VLESKYLNFIKLETKEERKTSIYRIENKSGDYLGILSFFPAWRKYVYSPAKLTKWDSNCLQDVVEKLNELTNEWREGLKKDNNE